MGDVHNKETRSYNMSRIRAKDTLPEMIVRKFIHAHGFRYTLHNKLLPGKPDIVLPKYKTVIMVNGCFWHGHKDCKYYTVPKTNTGWWQNKIAGNIANDEKIIKALKKAGWKVIIVWGCELKKIAMEKKLFTLLKNLKRIKEKIDSIHNSNLPA
jgi:DNA mismatch endonuclease, patch repair protein